MAHQNGRVSRAIINPVIKAGSRSFLIGIQGKGFFQPLAIGHVRHAEENNGHNKHRC